MTRLSTRDVLLACIPTGGTVAELGVFTGDFAAQILAICCPSSLHLVDRWSGRAECGDQDGLNLIVIPDMKSVWRQLRDRYRNDPRVHLHRMTTAAALASFPDGTLDFVYVDADHDEASVFADLTNAAPKVHGLIGGHDYCPQFPGVMRAVDRFCADAHWTMTHLTQDGCPSYLLARAA